MAVAWRGNSWRAANVAGSRTLRRQGRSAGGVLWRRDEFNCVRLDFQ